MGSDEFGNFEEAGKVRFESRRHEINATILIYASRGGVHLRPIFSDLTLPLSYKERELIISSPVGVHPEGSP